MIIEGENKRMLTAKNILSKISEYDIYRYYLGCDFTPRKNISSPFRSETRGSFSIYFTQSGYLRHLDFGDTYYKGNCFQFVQQLFGLDFNNALKKINQDFNLKLGFNNQNSSGVEYGSIIKTFLRPKEYSEEDAKRVTIHVQAKDFTKEDLDYWNQYGITLEELKKNNIYSVDKLYLNGKYIGNYKNELRFAYLFEIEGEYFFKIYQPLSEQYKWISNVPVKTPIGIKGLPRKSNKLIIAKSKKDKMIIQKIHSDVYEVQKEGIECIPEELNNLFDEWYDEKYIFYDNDEPGMKASIAMNKLGFKWINIPNEYKHLKIKDPGDLLEYFGVENGMNILDILLRRKMLNEG